MKRFLPYLRYLRGRRTALTLALICGAISGLVYGWGLPRVMNQVFPRIFTDAHGQAVAPVDLKSLAAGQQSPAAEAPKNNSPLREFFLGSTQPSLTPEQKAALAAQREAETAQIKAQRTLPPGTIIGYALLIPLIFLIRAICGFLNHYLMSHCGIGVLEAIRVELYEKLQHLPLGYFGRNRTGDLLARLTSDTAVIQQTITTCASDLIIQPITLLGALAFLTLTAIQNNGALLLLACLAAIPATIFPLRFVGKKLLRRAEENQRLLGDITDLATQNFTAAREVRAFGLEQTEVSRFRETSRRLFRIQLKVAKYSQALSPSIEVIASLGVAVALYYAYYSGLTLPVFISIIAALFVCYEPMKKLGNLHGHLTRGAASLNRIEEILHTPLTIADRPDARPLPRAIGHLRYENLSFAYEGTTEAAALVAITAEIPPGTTCALVGPSGAGKTTFANLVPRFYDPVAGRLTLDGHDLRDLRLADLRRHIALVSQEPVLFNDTIYNNILLGRPDATPAEVETAARDASAHEFILNQPHGYETLVGERGSQLSGGQRQRIALARAFLRDAPILILDEATSALDTESEAAIQHSLKKLMAGRTTLIIAHRFSTIRDANHILVFESGRIVASGTHAELYDKSPLYRALYDGQKQ